MKLVSMSQRVQWYSEAFPTYPPLHTDRTEASLYGIWVIGNSYKGSGYYGSYPGNYLKRVMSIFPDCDRVLHLFSGGLPLGIGGTRFDLNPKTNPDVVGDAHELSKHFPAGSFELIVADPPYSAEDSKRYGASPIRRKAVWNECLKVLTPGGFLVWLEEIIPSYRRDLWDWAGMIGLVCGTNRRIRGVTIMRKRGTLLTNCPLEAKRLL